MQAPGRAERARGPVLGALLVAALVVLVGVRALADGEPQAAPPPDPPEATAGAPAEVVEPVPDSPERVTKRVRGGLRFVDVTKEVGLASGRGQGAARPQDMDAGVAVADLDDDGDIDLLLTSAGASSGLYRNDGGVFTDVSGDSGIGPLTRATVAVFGDVDADADLDLFVGGPGHAFGRLLLNDGSGHFVDRTAARGVVGRSDEVAARRTVRGADFGDVDLDGDLDLLVTDWNTSAVVAAAVSGSGLEGFDNQCDYAAFMRRQLERGLVPPTGDSRLLLNDGNGSFADGTVAWGLRGLGATLAFTPQFHDLDADGWLDLVVAGDVCTSRVFRNDHGERFVDHTPASGAGTAENGMGSLVHDLDGDGRPDWLVTSIGYPTADGACPDVSLFAGCSGNRVFLNQGGMDFLDATDALGLRDSGWGWGVGVADFTNDGRVQVAVTNGTHLASAAVDRDAQESVFYQAFRTDASQLWIRRGSGEFADAAVQVGIDHEGVGLGLAPFDYDRDGRVDLLITHSRSAPVLYRNVTTPRRHWLTVRLDDPTSPGNGRGVGSRVEVSMGRGEPTTQWLHTSGSYESQRPAEVHVGLGGDKGPVRVRVWWPGATEPQVVRGVPVDTVVTVTRGR